MIRIKKSQTADTRSCDWSKVTKEQLKASSEQHIDDVRRALDLFRGFLDEAGFHHDEDKLTELDWFHDDFSTGFKRTGWWDNHRQISRHHLAKPDGVPGSVNLLDVLEMIADCVMAGMARTGTVYPLELPIEVLKRAFDNTVDLLKDQVMIDEHTRPTTNEGKESPK